MLEDGATQTRLCSQQGEHVQEGRQPEQPAQQQTVPRVTHKVQERARCPKSLEGSVQGAQEKVGWLGKVWAIEGRRVHKVSGIYPKDNVESLQWWVGVTPVCGQMVWQI